MSAWRAQDVDPMQFSVAMLTPPLLADHHLCRLCKKLFNLSQLVHLGRHGPYECFADYKPKLDRNQTPIVKIATAFFRRESLVFEREFPVGKYHADFYLPELNLIVEINGRQFHGPKRAKKDAIREKYLLGRGFSVATVNGTDLTAKLSAAVANRKAEIGSLDAEANQYEEKLTGYYEIIRKNPYKALPRPRKFRFKDDDFKRLARFQQRLVTEQNERYQSEMRRLRMLRPVPILL